MLDLASQLAVPPLAIGQARNTLAKRAELPLVDFRADGMCRPKYPPLHQPAIEEMPIRYIVSEWDFTRQTTGEIMATADNAIVAAAAFKAVGEQRPNRTIVLCHGARINDWHPERPEGA